MESLLAVRGLTKRYGDHAVLEGLDLEVAAGEAVVLQGRNGSGKTTVLRCVVGADVPTEGEITLLGKALDERSPAVRRDLAVVLDDIDFFPDLSVVEHLDLLAAAHGVDNAEQVVNEILDEVGLVKQSAQLPGSLSSGQRQRLCLASAFVRPRRLLVLDEPEQRLDAQGLEWLAGRLQAEKQAGLGMLLACHDPDLIAAVADRVIHLGR